LAPIPATSLTGTTSYYVSQRNTITGCENESERARITVTVNSLPVSPVVSDITYCKNAVASSLTATAADGHTLLWYGTNATGGSPDITAPIPSTTAAGATTYFVSQRKSVNECESERVSLEVTVNAVPVPVITANGLGTGNVQLSSSIAGGNQWYKDGSAIAGATTQTFAVLEDGIYQVNAIVEGCVSDLSEPFAVLVTDVKDNGQPFGLYIFPVPARETIEIQITGVKDDEISEMIVIDMAGRVISKQKVRGQLGTLLIEEYPTGDYFIRITNKSLLLHGRFVKY